MIVNREDAGPAPSLWERLRIDHDETTSAVLHREMARRRPGELKLKVRCPKCETVLGAIVGDGSGPRILTGRGGQFGNGHVLFDHRAGEVIVPAAFPAAEFAAASEALERVRWRCRPACGFSQPVRVETVVRAFIRAVRAGRSELDLTTI